jgi:hypothetical protein
VVHGSEEGGSVSAISVTFGLPETFGLILEYCTLLLNESSLLGIRQMLLLKLLLLSGVAELEVIDQ